MLWGRGAVAQLTIMTSVAMIAALLAAAVALFFASFLPPIVATAAAGLLVALPVAVSRAAGPVWMDSLPLYNLGALIANSPMGVRWFPAWQLLLIALLEAIAFWLLAALLFSTRDVAVAVE